jgi:hypothetical protein
MTGAYTIMCCLLLAGTSATLHGHSTAARCFSYFLQHAVLPDTHSSTILSSTAAAHLRISFCFGECLASPDQLKLPGQALVALEAQLQQLGSKLRRQAAGNNTFMQAEAAAVGSQQLATSCGVLRSLG